MHEGHGHTDLNRTQEHPWSKKGKLLPHEVTRSVQVHRGRSAQCGSIPGPWLGRLRTCDCPLSEMPKRPHNCECMSPTTQRCESQSFEMVSLGRPGPLSPVSVGEQNPNLGNYQPADTAGHIELTNPLSLSLL